MPGDINNDNIVDITDLITGLRALAGMNQSSNLVNADITMNNDLDLGDLIWLMKNVCQSDID
jgi:hypothetical protein